MDKDFRIWVEIAMRKRKCHRCGGEIVKGAMFVRLGNRERAKRSAAMCADCFDVVMIGLSQEFLELKKVAVPIADGGVTSPEQILRCPFCGLGPEKCRCGMEAYR